MISEANFWRHHDLTLTEIDNYKLETTQMIDVPDRKCSRLVMFVKDGVKSKRLPEFESDNVSSIWLELGLPYQKKILLGGMYREHDHLKTEENRESRASHNDQI